MAPEKGRTQTLHPAADLLQRVADRGDATTFRLVESTGLPRSVVVSVLDTLQRCGSLQRAGPAMRSIAEEIVRLSCYTCPTEPTS